MKESIFERIIGRLLEHTGSKKYDTGLVMSGGAARGFAHVGVFKALEENQINIDIVSGVSAGSIAGSFYCDGFSPEEIFDIFEKNKVFDLVKLRFSRKGLLSTSGLRKVLKNNLRTKKMEDLPKPLVINATNIEEGITTYFTEGNLVDIVVASCSIPVVFEPAKINNVTYVDGGVTNNFPIEPLEDKCKRIIGVHINPTAPYDPQQGIGQIALNSFHLGIASDVSSKSQRISDFIEPPGLEKFSYYDIKKGREMFDLGYNEAMKVLSRKN